MTYVLVYVVNKLSQRRLIFLQNGSFLAGKCTECVEVLLCLSKQHPKRYYFEAKATYFMSWKDPSITSVFNMKK